ncbi:MAG TPA: hypothetical protein DIU15_04425 [Deltaproteobacteria bacterium]|nr:hypothetical protein [Deltaproteobacteria bacterium]HCP45259.1 hypothetical protein [Deltaproteobacteria bacterium]
MGFLALCGLVVLAASSLYSTPASAAGKTEGVPIGDLVFRPSVNVVLVYDSNVYRAQLNPEADFGLAVRPQFEFVYPGENFRWELSTYWRGFTYFNVNRGPGINHDDLRLVNEFGVRTSVDLNRTGKFGFKISPQLYNRPSSAGWGDGDEDGARAAGDNVEQDLGVGVPIAIALRPTGAFHIKPGGEWNWARSYYPRRLFDPDPVVLGNRHEVSGKLGVDWRFFPRSHIVFTGQLGRILWGPYDEDTAQHGTDPQLPGTFFRALLGLRGDITKKVSFMAMGGYGGVYYGEDNESSNLTGPDGLLARVEFALRPVLTQRLALGFRRDFLFRYFADNIAETQGYFKYSGLFFGRLAPNASFSYTYRQIQGWLDRQEHQWAAGGGIKVIITPWLDVAVDYRFSAVNPSSDDKGEYIDNRVTLRISLGFDD